MAEAVIDASALVDLLLDNDHGRAVRRRVAGHRLHVPAHLDAEVLSALGRLHRAGDVDAATVERGLHDLASAPIQRHLLSEVVLGAWARRHQLRLADAIYVELAAARRMPLITTDRRLRQVPPADVVSA